MRNILLTLQFDGTAYHGWQEQAHDPTVQGTVRAALATLLGEPRPRLTGSSRTDAGVHAISYPCNFMTDSRIPERGLRAGLNSLLPPDIAVQDACEVDLAFDARADTIGKTYRYDLWNGPVRAPLCARTAWYVAFPLDRAAMAAAAAELLGDHDFSAFRAAHCDSRSTRRLVTELCVGEPEPGLVRVRISANAFLRNMVRIVVGTLVDVGRGRRSPQSLGALLVSGDRTAAGPTAPAHGLFLESVRYGPAGARGLGFRKPWPAEPPA